MQFSSIIKSTPKRWNLATLCLPLLGIMAVRIGLQQEGFFFPLFTFFRHDVIAWLYPYLFALSYIHIISSEHLRSLIMFVSCFGICLLGFRETAPLITIGLGLYICFSLMLIGVIKLQTRAIPFKIVRLRCILLLLLRILLEVYAPFFQNTLRWTNAPTWQYFALGYVAARVMMQIPVLIHDLPKLKNLSLAVIGSYLLNPIFFFQYVPISPSDYEDAGRRDLRSGLVINARMVLRGWVLILCAMLFRGATHPSWGLTHDLSTAPLLTFIHTGSMIISRMIFVTGLIKIFGYSIHEPFVGMLKSRTPADAWGKWNYYFQEWTKKFAFYPALQVVPNFYIALLWAFLINGIRHGLMYWFLSIKEVPDNTAKLWIFGPWLCLIIFLYRQFQRTSLFHRSQKLSPFITLTLRWAGVLFVLSIPRFVLKVFFS